MSADPMVRTLVAEHFGRQDLTSLVTNFRIFPGTFRLDVQKALETVLEGLLTPSRQSEVSIAHAEAALDEMLHSGGTPSTKLLGFHSADGGNRRL